MQYSTLVLIIEDSLIARAILAARLGRAGFEVKGCHDGVEAMRWLVQSQRVPALILVDTCLSKKVSGFDVAHRLHQKVRQAVVVMISRREVLLTTPQAQLAGVQAYVRKPFRTENLISVVTSLAGGQA